MGRYSYSETAPTLTKDGGNVTWIFVADLKNHMGADKPKQPEQSGEEKAAAGRRKSTAKPVTKKAENHNGEGSEAPVNDPQESGVEDAVVIPLAGGEKTKEAFMDYDMITERDQDIGRGSALLAAGAVMVLLTWILPWAAPISVAAYGIYRLTQKQIGEGLLFVAMGIVFWILRKPVEWLLWLGGVGIVGVGVFLILRGLRAGNEPE